RIALVGHRAEMLCGGNLYAWPIWMLRWQTTPTSRTFNARRAASAPRCVIPALAPSDKFIAASGITIPFFAVVCAGGLEIGCDRRCKLSGFLFARLSEEA